jgi:exodeoxyribonuclease-3
VFRELHPEAVEYSWWTYRHQARERDIGWRLDYFLVAESLQHWVQDASILGDVAGSDHCPVALTLKRP